MGIETMHDMLLHAWAADIGLPGLRCALGLMSPWE
jgi:hypothetical protein